MFTNWLIAVPARLASERLPQKPLLDLGGLPLIVRVARNLQPLADLGATIVVATDAKAVFDACTAHGIAARMTSAAHASGTDRCAEVAAGDPRPYVLNVQGDEPFVDISALTALMTSFVARAAADVGTLVVATSDRALAADPNVVKAVRGRDGYAVYFSRAPVPYNRAAQTADALSGSGAKTAQAATFWHHIGVYAYRQTRLQDFVSLGLSPLEDTEKLEQLRAIEAGWRIWLEPTAHWSRGIDTPNDLEAARARLLPKV